MPDITTYATATIARQLKGINDAVIDKNSLSAWMKKKGRIKFGLGGDSIKWRVYNAEPVIFGSTTDTGSRTAQTIQPITTAEVRYCQYDGEIMMYTMQLMRNKNADETSKLFNQMAEELNIFKQATQTHLGRHMYASTALASDRGTNISSIADIVSNTGTYAGIARSGNTYWQSQTVSISSPELDTDGNDVAELLEGMRSLYLDCSGGLGNGGQGGSISPTLATGREEPDAIFTTKAIYLNYMNVLTPQQRYSSQSGGRDSEVGGSLLFHNLPIEWDNFCTSGKLYMLNSNFIEINCATDNLIEAPAEFQGIAVPGRNVKTWALIAQLQMLSRNPKYHGVGTVS
jgi:hypothetical protein